MEEGKERDLNQSSSKMDEAGRGREQGRRSGAGGWGFNTTEAKEEKFVEPGWFRGQLEVQE